MTHRIQVAGWIGATLLAPSLSHIGHGVPIAACYAMAAGCGAFGLWVARSPDADGAR